MNRGFLIRALNQGLARATYFIATFRLRTKNLMQRSVTRSADKYRIDNELIIEDSNKTKFAILALFPRKPLRLSVNRLIRALTDEGFHIVGVINEGPDKAEIENWMTDLQNFGATVITRPNIGRDFAAFRAGYLYLEKCDALNSAERILFANDSSFYGPNSIAFTRKVLQEPGNWYGMFVNYNSELHMQSFFQVFTAEVFNSTWFAKYWHNYRASDLRHLTISRGELGLSALCRKHGCSPRGFVTAARILDDRNFNGFTPDEEAAIWQGIDLSQFIAKRGLEENLILFRKNFIERNVAHHHGLVASRVLGAPLKLDLFKSGFATNEGLRQTLSAMGCEADELEALIDYMNLAGSAASTWGFGRLWRAFGLS